MISFWYMITIKGFGISSQYPIIAFPVFSNAKYNLRYVLLLLKWQSKDTN